MTLEIVRIHERILKEDANIIYWLTMYKIKKESNNQNLRYRINLADFAQAVYRKLRQGPLLLISVLFVFAFFLVMRLNCDISFWEGIITPL